MVSVVWRPGLCNLPAVTCRTVVEENWLVLGTEIAGSISTREMAGHEDFRCSATILQARERS